MSEPPAQTELAYAPKPALGQRPLGRRLVIYLSLLILPLLLCVYLYVPRVRSATAWLMHYVHLRGPQAAALEYTAPNDQLVYSNDPAEIPALLASRKYVALTGKADALLRNPAFDQLLEAQSGLIAKDAPAIFLHRRKTAAGDDVIASVQVSFMKDDSFHRVFFYPCAQQITGPLARASRGAPPRSVALVLYRTPGDTIRIFDGKPDGSDPTRLTIRIDLNGTPFNLRGQLHPSGKFVLVPDQGKLAWVGDEFSWVPPGGTLPAFQAPGGFTTLPQAPVHYDGRIGDPWDKRSDDQAFPAPAATTSTSPVGSTP